VGRSTKQKSNPALGRPHEKGAQVAVVQILTHVPHGAVAYLWPRHWTYHIQCAERSASKILEIHRQVLMIVPGENAIRLVADETVIEDAYIAGGTMVSKGEKAITLCQPVTVKRRAADGADDDQSDVFTRFVYKPHWFVLAQTDGAELPAALLPTWDRARALAALGINEESFALMNGNVQGYARQRTIAVSPVAALPHKTTFHEVAHVLLGHTAEGEQADTDITPRSLREVEAECVAMLCCAALDLPGIAEARGYVQHWNGAGNPIPERSAQKILKVADQILKAGSAAPATGVNV